MPPWRRRRRPIFGPISVASNSANEMHRRRFQQPELARSVAPLPPSSPPLSSQQQPRLSSSPSCPFPQLARSLTRTKRSSLALDKLNWIMSAPPILTSYFFSLNWACQRRRVPPHFGLLSAADLVPLVEGCCEKLCYHCDCVRHWIHRSQN